MDAPLKKILRALSLQLRHTLEGSYSEDGTWNPGDLERRLNQIGIWRDRPVKPISEMPNLSPVDRKARELIDAYLTLRSDAGVSQSDAVAEFIRESAYSWANRLFALRCMEAREIIDPVILQEEAYHGRSMVHDRFAQTNPAQCTEEDDGLFAMLTEEFRERSQELPDLFAPDSPAVALRPSVVALKHCIALLSGSIPANGGKAIDDVFSAPDAFGWAYQFWNEEEKKRVNTRIKTVKGAKIEGCDIASYTTLYTEPYMVKYLIQNSLGATWMKMHPESQLSANWEYYVKDADRTPNERKPIAEITILDPACGSGHFLIEAFDLLATMYEDEGQINEPDEICRSILNKNLFGIDIDERAVQITKAVLWMKAAETVFAKTKKQLSGDRLSEFHDHIIATNIRLPKSKDHLDLFLNKHPEDIPLRSALLKVFEGLQNVHELGSLVQIEEPVENELKTLKEHAKQQKFDPESGEIVEKVNFSRWKQKVLKRLKTHFQGEAEKAMPTEAFFSQSAVRGLALFDLLAQRYDIVAANPPYMGSKHMGAWLKSYIGANYSEGKRDLYSAFILRDLQLAKNNGRVAMITQQSWMFQRSFIDFRAVEEENARTPKKLKFKGLLKETAFESIAHLGPRAFEEIGGVVVSSVLFVFSKNEPKMEQLILFFRLNSLNSASEKAYALRAGTGRYIVKQSDILKIKENPLIYWLNPHIFQIITTNHLLSEDSNVCQGIATANNDRYLKFFWEVEDFNRWIEYAKGGGYSRWAGFSYYVIDWEQNGAKLVNNKKSVIRNKEFFFKEGLTYSPISQGALGVRHFHGIFDVKGATIYPKNVDLDTLAGYLNSHFLSYLSRIICQGFELHVGYLANVPLPETLNKDIKKFSKTIYTIKKQIIASSLIERDFDYYIFTKKPNYLLASWQNTLESLNECLVNGSYKNSEHEIDEVFQETGIPVGLFPLITNYHDPLPLLKEISEVPSVLTEFLNKHECKKLSTEKNTSIKKRLRLLFESGPGTVEDFEERDSLQSEDEEESSTVGAQIPIPPETFLEELSQKMEIHPISIYWMLKEGIEKEEWRCIPEEKRYTEDLLTYLVLRLLGHRWPKQIEAGEPVPEWADPDGIIPITSIPPLPNLLQRVRQQITSEYPDRKAHEIEKEFEEVLGMTLERWLAGEFFKHHISQFKKHPIAWQVSSNPVSEKGRGSRKEPAFSCLVYYHKIDADILHKIRTHYVRDLIDRYETELRALESRENLNGDQATRKVLLENWVSELNDLSKSLRDVAEQGFNSTILRGILSKEPLDKWTSRDGKTLPPKSVDEFYSQEKRYDPDINDGVRVNIAPLQKSGLLSAEVIAKKDIEKAIVDRTEWRRDERCWCREGILPKCGWWRN
jgi:hypothetical protein